MKPQYLNAQQKQSLTFIVGTAQFLEQALEKNPKIPTKHLADLKRAKSFAWRGVTGWMKELDEKTQRQIINIIKDLDIGIISKADAKKWNEERARFIGGQEFADVLAESTLESRCKGCDGSPGSECPIREALIHYGVPAWNESDPVCEYIGSGSVDE